MDSFSHIKIRVTRNYGQFNMLAGNRVLNERKVNALISDIRQGNDLLEYFPILVDDKMNVLDGQHRLYAAKKTNSNVYYIITDKSLDISIIAGMNSRSSSWKPKDYLNCYIRRMNDDYIKVQALMDYSGVKISTALQLLAGNALRDGGNNMIQQKFASGKFKVHDYEKVISFIDAIKLNFKWFEKINSRVFLQPLLKIYFLFGTDGIERLSKKIKKLCNQDPELLKNLYGTNMKYYLGKIADEFLLPEASKVSDNP